jgi:Heparinase II/III-like protein/Heparinase II/III N-terminus
MSAVIDAVAAPVDRAVVPSGTLTPVRAPSVAPIWRDPWAAHDDAALLAHFRSPRGVHLELIVDEDECSEAKLAGVLQGRFEFNGETHALPDPLPWLHNPSADVEWHILLHKFYYAPGLARAFQRTGDARLAGRWVELIDGWIEVSPPGFIAADVTGRRVQNWIYSLAGFVAHGATHQADVGAAFLRRLLGSLHRQVEFLCENLTPKRNHRTLELYAIFLAGVAFPEMRRAPFWREFALRETLANMRADLLADGVHCELSTDYHHLALRNWLHVRTLAARHQVAVPKAMDVLLERALEFSLHVHKPDGNVPSLSDGDVRGFLPLLAQGAELYGRDDMRWVAARGALGHAPARTAMHFSASGYTVLRSGWGSAAKDFGQSQYLVLDSGPLGEGNHGHFDCLSFELAGFGRSLVVDPGRYTYSEAPIGGTDENWRVRFRGTAAHNTVCVDGRNQTRYVPKAIKETSRHAHGSVRHKVAGPAPDAALLEFAHSPSVSVLHGRAASAEYDAVHERVIVFVGRRYWIVSDTLRAQARHDYALRFQLSEQATTLTRLRDDAQGIHSPNLLLVQPTRSGQHLGIVDSWVSPRYGCKLAAPAVVCRASAANVDFDTVLVPFGSDPPEVRVVDIAADPTGACANEDAMPCALRIDWQDAQIARTDLWFHARRPRPVQVTFAGYVFEGRWVLLQHDAAGTLQALSHPGARLHRNGEPLEVQRVEAGPR